MDDAILFSRFVKGDAEAVEEVVSEYAGGLLVFVFGIIKDSHASEDIVEDVFAALIGGRAKYKGDAAFKTYLYRSAQHKAFNYLRKNKRTAPIEEAENIAAHASLEESYIIQERKIQLYRALERLPADYRTVLMLIYFEDMSYNQAAKVMEKNESQIRNLAHRGKLALRDILIKEGFTYED